MALLLLGCASSAEAEGSEPLEEARRSVGVGLTEPLEIPVSFSIEDASGALSETITLEIGYSNASVDVPTEVPDDAEITVTLDDAASLELEGYELAGEPSLVDAFSDGSETLTFLFAIGKGGTEVGAGSADPTGSVTWHMSSEKGYSFDLSLDLYPAVDGGEVDGNLIGSVCEFDPAQDVAIPGRMTVTATTADFATPIAASLMIQHQTDLPYTGAGAEPMREDGRLKIERYLSSGSECDGWSSTGFWAGSNPISVKWTDPLDSGDTARSDFTIIVKNVFTPNTPEGDSQLLDWIEVRAGTSATSNEQTGAFTDAEGTAIGGVSTKGINLNGAVVGPRQ